AAPPRTAAAAMTTTRFDIASVRGRTANMPIAIDPVRSGRRIRQRIPADAAMNVPTRYAELMTPHDAAPPSLLLATYGPSTFQGARTLNTKTPAETRNHKAHGLSRMARIPAESSE